MKVAVIGTGNVGTALGGALVQSGHEVTLAARDTEKARAVASEVGARAVARPTDAVRDAAVVVLAVPFGALDEVADEIRQVAAGKVVVDVTNPLTPDFSGLATEGRPSAAEQLAGRLPEARVVKAFNTLFASILAQPLALSQAPDALIATDHEDARDTVAGLASSIGLRPINAGPLNAARQLEALAWLNMRIQMQSQGDWRSTVVFLGAPPAAIAA